MLNYLLILSGASVIEVTASRQRRRSIQIEEMPRLTLFGYNTFRHVGDLSQSTRPVWTEGSIQASSAALLASQSEDDDSNQAVETC
jgi:hypothetical protein